jgi:hypothetical protein
MSEHTPALECKLWRLSQIEGPETPFANSDIKARFWKHWQDLETFDEHEWLDVNDKVAGEVARAHQKSPRLLKEHREGDPNTEYDTSLVSKMEECTPQFNLRNVMRIRRDVDMDYMEWTPSTFPNRHGYRDDLAEVRATRFEPPVFFTRDYASNAMSETRRDNWTIFYINDWEQWFGQDKRRQVGAMWQFVPEDGGIRTRPWDKVKVVPHKYWKGRLIQD